MDDLISRAWLLNVAEYVIDLYTERYRNRITHQGRELTPSAQPERKTGRWLKISPAGIYECSECGKTVITGDISCYKCYNKYCSGCGAYMGGEQDGSD